MHTFEKLDEFITNLAETHHLAAKLYTHLQSTTDSQRLQMLLGDMADKENRLSKLTTKFLEQCEQGTRDTYMQYSLEVSFEELTKPWIKDNAPIDIASITLLGQEINNYLVNLLEGALRELPAPHTNELLSNLLQLEKAEQRTFTQEIMSSYEI